jgi:hypothetical protein
MPVLGFYPTAQAADIKDYLMMILIFIPLINLLAVAMLLSC